MSETSRRAWLASAIAFACAEAYFVATARGACVGYFNVLLSTIIFQIIIPNIGIFIVTVVSVTAVLTAVTSLKWRVVLTCAISGTAFLTMLLFGGLQTQAQHKMWIAGPLLGGIALCALTTLAVRRLPLPMTATLGAIAAVLCFAITYIFTPYTGSGGCFPTM